MLYGYLIAKENQYSTSIKNDFNFNFMSGTLKQKLVLKQLSIFDSIGMILTFEQIECYNQEVKVLVSNNKLKSIFVEDFLFESANRHR